MNENNGDVTPDAAQWAPGTLAIHGGQVPDPTTGAVMPPIYATSTYAQSSPGVHQRLGCCPKLPCSTLMRFLYV